MHPASLLTGLLLSLTLTFSTLPAQASDRDETVMIKMETSAGTITLALYPGRAPITVANFLKLVDDGQYDGGQFYRVVTKDNDNGSPKIEVIQGGNPEIADTLEPIQLEVTGETGIEHKDGAISMARGGANTATSEFFICIGDQTSLDFGGTRNPDGQGFAAFGHVTDGMDVVRKIQGMTTNDDADDAYVKGQMLKEPVTILKISREGEPAAKPAEAEQTVQKQVEE
ncbi:MAG: peptidylprolyl isomerase [Alphaproteobacteria bacterium]|nr:MAG: peptidylprolyl isomerase [Alphaproteobacteria bacterium]